MLVLPVEITHKQARSCAQTLSVQFRAESGSHVELDVSPLVKFDSSALAVMLECRREALSLGKTFQVKGLASHLRELANLYGIVDLLEVQHAV